MDENQHKWVSKLMGYKFEIKYKSGAENRVVDALSRCGESAELYAISVWKYEDKEEWDQEVKRDSKMASILQRLITGQQTNDKYSLKNGCLLFKGCLVLPKGSPRIPGLLKEFHSSPIGGHSGYLRTYKRLF
ncbi:uncharacterized protein [Nicotiana tomentosiformis]|uniref:uncharacterized protein n=1 Tax=Nicotiana tomentosiformis TaxID=4098 RepID=UPI00051B861B|nr:uncharacterized protein LOC104116900 [Nicotiana tomentosiformis]